MTKKSKSFIIAIEFIGDIMKTKIIDGCQAVSEIAYKLSEVIPIFPITPSSPMAEHASNLNSKGVKNLLNEDVKMIEMQSEAGVAGVLHGATLARALSCTFTSSQGLLLMIPNMYKIAGECLPSVIHVASRAVASHALSIFCDHGDIMATRMTGFLMLASNSVQEAHYMALASHLLALKSSLPVLHFFDGFRTSHEIQKIKTFEDHELIPLFKNLALKFKSTYEDKQYGTAQNPDVFFQNRERNETAYQNVETHLLEIFKDIKNITGKQFAPFEYFGHQNAENIIVSMGSSCETIEEYINQNPQEKIGLIKVRLYRPFLSNSFLKILPKTAKIVTVLDRTKENGAIAPLALDVISTLTGKNLNVEVICGRYGLGGKDFSPSHVHTIYTNMINSSPKNNFTIGINDDISNSSLTTLPYNIKNNSYSIKILGLGSDGSVSASKATIKILGEKYNKFVQGYFEYDSKKSGSLTISHLRLSDNEIKSEYLVKESDLICINNFSFVGRYDCLDGLKNNSIVLLNTIFGQNDMNEILPKEMVEKINKTNSKFFVIDAQKIARECQLGSKINIIMQTALFKCANLLSDNEIEDCISNYIKESFSLKGEEVVEKNISAMQHALDSIIKIDTTSLAGKSCANSKIIENKFYNEIMQPISKLNGENIPVSKFDKDGSSPLATSKFEKRGIASRLPLWIKENCIQCGKCVFSCPHSALSAILAEEEFADRDSFANAIGLKGKLYKILLSPEDCTGCGVCAKTCPAIKKALEMKDAEEILDEKIEEYAKTISLQTCKQTLFSENTAKGLQFNKSLFEFPGACAGCGETPYLKLLTMINGSNMMIANATGCSSIYAGSFGSCPYGKDENGGIFWANSLFEDNAEFGLGIKLGNNFTKNKDKNVWIIGGDGWADDIGFGGLDHVLASEENVNILVLDNQSYSNTGGQSSKATPTGASVKFAENGKHAFKKNLARIALSYPNVYVAQIALGGSIEQAIKAFREAQQHNGVSIIIAYSPCINQGFELSDMMSETKKAVDCGFWPIFRYVPKEDKLYLESDLKENEYFEFLNRERRFQTTIKKGQEKLLEKQKNQAINDYNYLKNKSEN